MGAADLAQVGQFSQVSIDEDLAHSEFPAIDSGLSAFIPVTCSRGCGGVAIRNPVDPMADLPGHIAVCGGGQDPGFQNRIVMRYTLN